MRLGERAQGCALILTLVLPPSALAEDGRGSAPSAVWAIPFVALLLCIALLPLFERTRHWWDHNRNKLAVAVSLSLLTLAYYALRGEGFPHAGEISAPGIFAAVSVLQSSLLEYVPFIVLLFALYVISGGIRVAGDIAAHPRTNTAFLAIGAVLASVIGTTGASMLLIRPLLQINSERKRKVHTVIFFIFIVSNAGGALTPVGDPPLFLGYLMGVPFLWTVQHLWPGWLFVCGALLLIYFFWDLLMYRREDPADIRLDETRIEPLKFEGMLNLVWLAGVVIITATVDPSRPVPGIGWTPFLFCRELVLSSLVLLSLRFTEHQIRERNAFNYTAIAEVACLFIGIFITMQVPIEILRIVGPELGINSAAKFFWWTGTLSSFLDNAPTYAVFFQIAGTLTPPGDLLHGVQTATGSIGAPLLVAVSYGSVFMGANSYIGNGPNFMVKSIAESSGVKMPSFLGYILCYSLPVLIPLFWIFTLLLI